jgi:choline/ethanolamine kinase
MTVETFLRPCNLTTVEALDLIRRFFTKEWKKLTEDDITLFRLQAGMCNSVYIVERKVALDTKVPAEVEPIKVVIRKFGGNAADNCKEIPITPREAETLVIQEAAKLGIGPKVYGIFEGGRLEEFVDSRHLTTKDMKEDTDLRREVAITLAKFHGMDIPLARPQYEYWDILKALQVSWDKVKHDYLVDEGVLRNKVNAKRIVDFDFAADLDWLEKLHDDKYHRMVLQHWDPQYSNILIRQNIPDNDRRSRVFLIDDELVTYNIRGKDIGLLFSQQVLDFQNKSDKIGKFPSEEESYLFLKEYQDEVERLGFIGDFDRNGKDSLENLYMESLIGGMGNALVFLLYFLAYHHLYTHSNDIVIHNTPLMFDWYLHVKDIFEKRFPKLASNMIE